MGLLDGGDFKEKANAAFDGILKDHAQEIAAFLREKVGPGIIDTDDQTMTNIANYIYGYLPSMVRMIISESKFADFILAHRQLVAEKLSIVANANPA